MNEIIMDWMFSAWVDFEHEHAVTTDGDVRDLLEDTWEMLVDAPTADVGAQSKMLTSVIAETYRHEIRGETLASIAAYLHALHWSIQILSRYRGDQSLFESSSSGRSMMRVIADRASRFLDLHHGHADMPSDSYNRAAQPLVAAASAASERFLDLYRATDDKLGRVAAKVRQDVFFEELIATTWHPSRVMSWCLDHETRKELVEIFCNE